MCVDKYVPALKACQLNADVDMDISWTMMENLAQVGGKNIQTLPKDDTWYMKSIPLYIILVFDKRPEWPQLTIWEYTRETIRLYQHN